jgi:sporulation protein YlmC with PRC-barrel domain
MAKDYRTEDGAQIAPLSDLSDFQVAEGYRDIRGWRVESADGKEVGKVHDLLVDLDGMRTRYLDVRLDSAIAATHGDRDVLIPIGTARIASEGEVVIVPLNADRVTLLPAYDHSTLTRSYESEIRRHFTLGEAAAGAAAASVAAATGADRPVDRGVYDDEAYDDRRFFETRRAKEDEPVETRIPVDPEDTVMLKRGEGGNDEIIVRRPRTP